MAPTYLETGRWRGSQEPRFLGSQDRGMEEGQLPSSVYPSPTSGKEMLQIPLPASPDRFPFALLPPSSGLIGLEKSMVGRRRAKSISFLTPMSSEKKKKKVISPKIAIL